MQRRCLFCSALALGRFAFGGGLNLVVVRKRNHILGGAYGLLALTAGT